LQQLASTPLLIAIDQEGGRVNRLKEKFGFPPTVSAQSLGAANDPGATRRQAEQTATTLARLGINLNFAPVVDLNTNPENPVIGKLERSFSADSATVTWQAQVWIEAHHQHGILCALKHFPGHGSSRADSHLGFVDVTETWTRAELEPYRQLIQAGLADVIMTAHIFNAKLDPNVPATLSRPVLTGILRGELGYQGVVVSDDMQMKAISAHYGLESAIQQAVNAGVDILVFGNNSLFDPEIAQKAISILRQSVKEGIISQGRIEESYQRIVRLKKRVPDKVPAAVE
jgi:beta-N-acetylhexosaminidase